MRYPIRRLLSVISDKLGVYVRKHTVYEKGDTVLARVRIVEDDAAPDPTAGRCETGWVHCEPGDTGWVEYVAVGGLPTVRFHRMGTATICNRQEIERV